MASCATIDQTGLLHQDTTSLDQCQGVVLLSAGDYAAMQAMNQPFDYGQATTLWGFAFSSVLLCWFVARGAGTILGLIRKG